MQICGNIYYDEKTKDGTQMKQGIYDSLKIIIGDGKGQNWWSLIYPNAYDSVIIYDEQNNTIKDDTHHLNTSDVISSENISLKFGIIEFFKNVFKNYSV